MRTQIAKDYRIHLLIVAASVLFLLAPGPVLAQEEGTFTGSWHASGKYQPIKFMTGREVYSFWLEGQVSLTNNLGKIAEFRSECTGLWDNATGSEGRCVWNSKKGAKVFIVLRGRAMEKGIKVTAEVVGGTGSLQDVEGIASFIWTSIYKDPKSNGLMAYTEDISGSYLIPDRALKRP